MFTGFVVSVFNRTKCAPGWHSCRTLHSCSISFSKDNRTAPCNVAKVQLIRSVIRVHPKLTQPRTSQDLCEYANTFVWHGLEQYQMISHVSNSSTRMSSNTTSFQKVCLHMSPCLHPIRFLPSQIPMPAKLWSSNTAETPQVLQVSHQRRQRTQGVVAQGEFPQF